jgi:hypothetical protein
MTYAYSLDFEEKPDYDRMIFMLKKILLDRDFLPDNKFDWSMRTGEQFKRVNLNDKHSSISSCCISSSEEVVDPDADAELKTNINKHRLEYSNPKKLNYPLLQQAFPGQGDVYFKIPDNFVKVGELQYLP